MGIFMSPSQMTKLMTAAKLQKTLQFWTRWLSFTDYSFVFLKKKKTVPVVFNLVLPRVPTHRVSCRVFGETITPIKSHGVILQLSRLLDTYNANSYAAILSPKTSFTCFGSLINNLPSVSKLPPGIIQRCSSLSLAQTYTDIPFVWFNMFCCACKEPLQQLS